MSQPKEMQEALMRLKCPCENDRFTGFVCDEEATHKTPSGSFKSHGWSDERLTKYLAVPK